MGHFIGLDYFFSIYHYLLNCSMALGHQHYQHFLIATFNFKEDHYFRYFPTLIQ